MKPLILIDARFWDSYNGGLSKYAQGLIFNLAKLPPKFHYLILTHHCSPHLPSNFKVIPTYIPHYSLKEQLLFTLIQKYHPQLIHYLHFNHPIFTPTPFLVTIHDLIKNFFPQPTDSTHSYLGFHLKRWGYKIVLRHALYKSAKIITPTQSVKNQIIDIHPQLKKKIIPIYEGIYFQSSTLEPLGSSLPSRYFLYVGSLYQHKNVTFLIKNIKLIRQFGLDLIIVVPGKINKKWQKLLQKEKIIFFSNLKESQLRFLYYKAYAFISPSLMEGFGLPVIEALSFGKPVILSDIPVFREITHQKMVYFSPSSSFELKKALRLLERNYVFYEKMSENLASYYDFHTTAVKTEYLYSQILNNSNEVNNK